MRGINYIIRKKGEYKMATQITSEINESDTKSIISEVIDDINKAIPIIKNLLESASFSLNEGNFEEAGKILSPTIATLNFISQMIEVLESEIVDENIIKNIKINNEELLTVQKRWIDKIEELKDSINKKDLVRASDIIAYEFPYEIENQVNILNTLLSKK
jgi:hypothetical protein